MLNMDRVPLESIDVVSDGIYDSSACLWILDKFLYQDSVNGGERLLLRKKLSMCVYSRKGCNICGC
jgi:hypothetical protein